MAGENGKGPRYRPVDPKKFADGWVLAFRGSLCRQCGGRLTEDRKKWATPVCRACVPEMQQPRLVKEDP